MKKQNKTPRTATGMSRKQFLRTSAVAAGAFALPRFSIGKPGPSANSKLNIAYIGAGNQAAHAYGETAGENIIALVDVDSSMFLQHAKRFPALEKAEKFADFRVMFDKLGDQIDAVCVSTPDHTHFPATMEALQRGKHVAVQKPLTHSPWEARTLSLAHKKYGGMTVMANQGHTYDGIRQLREWYEADVLGEITTAHSWVTGPNWNSKFFSMPESFPPPVSPVPSSLDYDLWLGPSLEVPYHKNYHPLSWRGFNQFGSGQMGDWFCHIADAPVWLLNLYEPTVIEAEEVAGGNEWMAPDGVRVRFEFPARGKMPPCTFYWGNGPVRKKPENIVWTWDEGLLSGGSYMQGEKSNVYTDWRSNNPRLAIKEEMRAFKEAGYPAEKYPRVTGGSFGEWVKAIKGDGPEPGSNMQYGSRLTEVSLLGVLAARVGGRIEWDAKNFRITNRPELNQYLRDPVRKGWEYGEDLWKGIS